ncbi:MAG: hypothetical protein M0R77_00260 [Gammaproteobacteria bacterium]|nr:hypothetical protein [Acholeplasmataceae bacterium]MCK9528987.1 hypothetical protein [Gammaproteobacteria bacterium]
MKRLIRTSLESFRTLDYFTLVKEEQTILPNTEEVKENIWVYRDPMGVFIDWHNHMRDLALRHDLRRNFEF